MAGKEDLRAIASFVYSKAHDSKNIKESTHSIGATLMNRATAYGDLAQAIQSMSPDQEKFEKAFSEAGKRGAAKRWAKDGDSEVIGGLSGGVPKANAKQETINIKHKPLTNIKPIRTNVLEDYFEDFWYKYPKKVGKEAARKAWNKANPDIIKVIDAINWQRETKQWQAEDGKYIPNPATYLNQGRWQDEAPVQAVPF